MITKVTGKNQVTIPASLARELHITPGTELDWSKDSDEGVILVHVKPSPDAILRKVRELGTPYRAKARQALDDLQRMRGEDDAEPPQKKYRRGRR